MRRRGERKHRDKEEGEKKSRERGSGKERELKRGKKRCRGKDVPHFLEHVRLRLAMGKW